MPNPIDARERFAAAATTTRPSWRVENTDDTRTASLHLYGVIGGWWGEIDATDVVPAIRALDVDTLTVYVNSPGGDVYDSIAIRNALRSQSAHVTVIVDGLAASGGSVIATGANEVIMADGAEMMIHDAWTIALGNAEGMRDVADDLDRISDNIAGMYATKAGGNPDAWRDLMRAETWYSATEAVEAGLADRVDTEQPAAKAAFDLSMYARANRTTPTAPDLTNHPAAAMATHPKETSVPTPTTAASAEDVTELREGLSDVQRSLAMLADRPAGNAAPNIDTRSAGEWIRGLAAGDEDMIREYNGMVRNAYAGGTSEDGILAPQYVGDTISLINAPDVLSQIFASSPLPAKGLKLEYGVLDTDTTDVEEQIAEGDDLTEGNVSIDVEHADIKTYGGLFRLSRQQIERTTNVNVLNLHWRALALKASRRKTAVLRSHYANVVAANALLPERTIVVADQEDYLDWIGGIVDAAEVYQSLGLSIDAIVADKETFKTLAGLTGTDGRPLMRVSGTGVNTIGEIAPKALGGDLASVAVRVNLGQSTPGAAFVNGEAIRQYASSVTELSDEEITNLTKAFGLYYYAANATEIPGAILPVVAVAPEGD